MQNKKFKELHQLIGNTPLVKIDYEYEKKVYSTFFKIEWYSLTGSVKDRIILHILEKAYERGELKVGQPIIETTTGSTGVSLSAIGGYLGHPVTILMPEYMSEERKKLMKSYGASLHLVKREEGGFLQCLKIAKELQKTLGAYLPLQFENEENISAHYLYTAPEILKQMAKLHKTPDSFISGVGTAGTLMGIGKKFKEVNKSSKVYALEPASSPTLRLGHQIGTHKIQGLVDEFVAPLLDYNLLDGIIEVHDDDAILLARKLAKELGLGVGISSGANFLGAVIINSKEQRKQNTVSIFADNNKKYLSTDLTGEVLNKENYLTNKIKFLDMKVIK